MTSPSATVAAILAHIQRSIDRTGAGPVRQKGYAENGYLKARIEGTGPDGVTSVTVATNSHAWQLRTFAIARRLRVEVMIDQELGADG